MKQIAEGPTATFSCIVPLIQKQCINLINSNIYINYWPPGTVCLERTIIQAKQRMGSTISITNYSTISISSILWVLILTIFEIFDCSPLLFPIKTCKYAWNTSSFLKLIFFVTWCKNVCGKLINNGGALARTVRPRLLLWWNIALRGHKY